MGRRASILFFTLVISFLIISCHKDSYPSSVVPNKGVVPVPQNLMDYAFFKPGTWWVYQDSVSSKYDSLYVTTASSGWDTIKASAGLGYTGIFGWFSLKYYNSHGFYYDQYCHSSYGVNAPRIPVYFDKAGPQYYSTQGVLMTSSFLNGDKIFVTGSSNQQGYLMCEGVTDSVMVKSTTYKNTVRFYNSVQIVEKDNRTMTYFAKNIGIIKKQLLDSNQNWQLARYNIVQ